tara:strand:- start:556 stop:2001 length:1446 start_codon:yes stop_codon:yes gene_type:complete
MYSSFIKQLVNKPLLDVKKSVRKSDDFKSARGKFGPLTAVTNELHKSLLGMLSIATPMGSEHLMEEFLPKGADKDQHGNYILHVGKSRDHHTVFSSHLDTVHKTAGKIVPIISDSGIVFAETLEGKPSVLGADDKVGVWLMLQMIEAKIPGIYAFHYGEERGGVGSSALVSGKPQWLGNIKKCIAFDRANYGDVIDTQFDKCCSKEFAEALSLELNKHTPPRIEFKPARGTFTDSANYAGDVPECTNISVGYFQQHSTTEHFDAYWVQKMLLPAILKLDWAGLPVVRDPAGSRAPKHTRKIVYTPAKPSIDIPYARQPFPGSDFQKADWKTIGTSPSDMPEMDIMTDTFPIDFSMSLLQKESSLHKTAQMVGLRGLITGIISLIEWKGKARITFDNLNDLLDSRDKAVKALTAQNSDFEKEKSALESIITVLDDKAIAMEKLILETFGDEEGLVHLKAVYAEMDLDFETIMLEDKVPDCVN